MTNDTSKPPRETPSWTRRIILIVVVSGVLAILAALAWPTIEIEKQPLGLRGVDLSRFLVAVIVAATFSIVCFLVYFVAKKSLWDFLDLLIVPLALAIIGFGFTVQQQSRQTHLENRRDARAQAVEEQRAQNEALQAYLDQMTHLVLEKHLLGSKEGDTVFTLAQARTTTVITQVDGEHNQSVTRFLYDSGLLRDPALLADADLEGANLTGAMLQGATLKNTLLNRANLTEAVLDSADFSAKEKERGGITLKAAHLTRADLTNASLQNAHLAECTLDKVTLTKAALQDADLRGASLQDANLSYAALQDADLSSAEGTANLKDAPRWVLKKLSGADLTDANLSHAALQDANLSGADLTDADLTDAKGWTTEQLTAARSLEGATMPNGQKYEDWLKSRGSGEDGKTTPSASPGSSPTSSSSAPASS